MIIIVFIFLLIILAIITLIVIMLNYVKKPITNKEENYTIYQYPNTIEYHIDKYINILPKKIDLNNINNNVYYTINDTLRHIGIYYRKNIYINFINLKEKKYIYSNIYKTIGIILISNNNNMIIFLDDFILNKELLNFKLIDFNIDNNKKIKLLKQFIDIYNELSVLHINNSINDLYVYSRGCCASLAYLIYFTSKNIGLKEFLIEGYPSMINDPENNLSLIISKYKRSIFINNLNDPLLDFIQTTELTNDGEISRFDNYKSSTQVLIQGLKGYQNHDILNYYGIN